MIEVFYKSSGQILVSNSEAIFSQIPITEVLWIDLFAPTGEEKRAAESFLGITLQTRAQAEEIESSSRFFETDDTIFANTSFIIPGPDEYNLETVSFILNQDILTTIREAPLRTFTDLQRRIQAFPKNYSTGELIFMSIVELRVDLDADIVELMNKEIAQYSRKVNLGEDINEEFLLDINQMQENTMLVRENVVDKQRVIYSIMKSDNFPPTFKEKLDILLKDIVSLINHTNFNFERLEYLQNTVIGIINLDQNKIMKIFTLVSLLLMPPTLIASFFGMNVNFGSVIASSAWVWIAITALMLMSFAIIWIIFKKKKML